jgi:hypothetical protein
MSSMMMVRIKTKWKSNQLPVTLRQSERISKAPGQWWMTDMRNPVNYTFNVFDEQDNEQLHKEARDIEYNTLMEYNTWDLVLAPENRKIVGSKWVNNVKRDGTYKSRLVCQGFSQVEGVDYFNTFSPIAKASMVCMVFMLAAVHNLELIWAAYLNAKIDVPIYMKQPKGYDYEKGDLVCKLNKALYGTKQAGRARQLNLKGFLETCGFKPSVYNPCCYTMQCKGRVIIMVVWVDDINTAYHKDCQEEYVGFRNKFRAKFQLKEMDSGTSHQCKTIWILGMEVLRNREQNTLSFNCTDK